MTGDDILQFVHRDWAGVAASKTRFWHDLKSRRTPAELLAVADQLRQEARRLRPSWPSAEDRLNDLAVHRRVAEALRAVTRRPR